MSTSTLAPAVAESVGRLLGSPPAAFVPRDGGYTRATTGFVTSATCSWRLVHGDLWYANLCFAPRGPVVVDWGSAMRGDATLDRATVAMDLVLTGRDPALLEVPDLPAWLAFLGGHLAREATEPLPPTVADGSSLRADQLADAAGLLDALVDLLDLPARDPRRGVAGTAPHAHTRPR